MNPRLARGANCARLEVLLNLVGISVYVTTDGGDIDQGGRKWHEIGRSEEMPHSGERAYWGLGLYAIAVNTKLSDRLLACPVRKAARLAAQEAAHEAVGAEYAVFMAACAN